MNIQHDTLFDTAKIEAHYTEKDGVEEKPKRTRKQRTKISK